MPGKTFNERKIVPHDLFLPVLPTKVQPKKLSRVDRQTLPSGHKSLKQLLIDHDIRNWLDERSVHRCMITARRTYSTMVTQEFHPFIAQILIVLGKIFGKEKEVTQIPTSSYRWVKREWSNYRMMFSSIPASIKDLAENAATIPESTLWVCTLDSHSFLEIEYMPQKGHSSMVYLAFWNETKRLDD